MKILLVFFAVLGFTLGRGLQLKEDVRRQIVEEVLKELRPILGLQVNAGSIDVIVNEYADTLFQNIATYAAVNDLDPIHLDNITEETDAAALTLWNGNLYGISTIDRDDDVTLTYVHDEKTLYMHFPIVFSQLKFSFDYHVRIFDVGPWGVMHGDIANFRADIQLSFNFNTFHANVDSISTWGMGDIDLTFEGNGLIDAVVNLLTEVVTTILHPLIEGIVDGIINDVAVQICGVVNDGFDNLLRPNSTNTTNELFY